jgi:hypothetical protein
MHNFLQAINPDITDKVTSGDAVNTMINILSVALLLAVLEYLRRATKT